MAKKTFKAAVMETQRTNKLETLIPTGQADDNELNILRQLAKKRKAAGLGNVGRPKRKDKDNTTAPAAERGTLPGETRKTLIVNKEAYRLLEDIAHTERITIKQALAEAITVYTKQYQLTKPIIKKRK